MNRVQANIKKRPTDEAVIYAIRSMKVTLRNCEGPLILEMPFSIKKKMGMPFKAGCLSLKERILNAGVDEIETGEEGCLVLRAKLLKKL